MNLLKIFTYGGIIEVFVVPHILPCVMGFIPSHISDMIQLAVSLISSLFPHISVNVQSEVFFKVWKDDGGYSGGGADDDQPAPQPHSLSDFKSDTTATSSSDGSSPGGSPRVQPPYSTSTGCRPCGSAGPTAPSRDDPTTGRPPKDAGKDGGRCPDICQRLAQRLTTEAVASTVTGGAAAPRASSHRQKVAFAGQSTTSSLLSERSDLFARSCSAEYQVKPANTEERVDLRSSATDHAGSFVEHLHPSFVKSCSLEYTTVVKTPRADSAEDTEPVATSVAELESRRTTNEVRHLALSDGRAAVLESKRASSAAKFSESTKKLQTKKTAALAGVVAPSDEVKPIYFGDNYQNLGTPKM